MKKFSKFVVKNKYIFLGVFFALIVASAVFMNFVNVNYDLTKYLPENSSTKQSIELMEEEFGSSGTASIMIENISYEDGKSIAVLINNVDGVATCLVTNYSAEKESALLSIFLTNGDYTEEAEGAINGIKSILHNNLSDEQNFYLTGSAVSAVGSRLAISSEIPVILAIAVAIVLIILSVTTKSWIEPVILLLVIGTAILINMGTNILLGEISFISNSISSVLLIALAMDYSIVLVNRFREEKEKTADAHEAMSKALSGCMTTIIASGLTVMAGLISLVFMDYKIGFDLGLVLTKGVFISILAVIFLMPAILLLFSKLISKTEHKDFLGGLKHIGTFAKKTRFIIPPIFAVLIVCGTVIQFTDLDFNYVAKFASSGNQIVADQEKTESVFGKQNTLVVILPNSIDITTQVDLTNSIKNIEVGNEKVVNNSSSFATMSSNGLSLGTLLNATALSNSFGISLDDANAVINSTTTTSTISGTAFAFEIIENLGTNTALQTALSNNYPPQLLQQVQKIYADEQTADSIFNSNNYTRMIFNINAESDSDVAISYINSLNQYLSEQNLTYNIVNNTQNVVDTASVFTSDRLKVELISALAILLIVTMTFRSVSLPLILVLGIEGAIMINLASNALIGNPIFFICYLIGTAIQMGATIDYGILLTDRYKMARRSQNKFDAIKTAIDKSFATILSSGSILTLAAFTIGVVSSVPLISSIGYLVGFGALCATVTILFVIPQTLLIFDKLIQRTTYKANFLNENKKPE